MYSQLVKHFKMNILLVLQWGCYYLFHLWTSHPAYAESSAAIDAYYVNYQKGIIMNKDFCPRLQSNHFNPLNDESKDILLGLDEHIHSSKTSLVDDCGFKIKSPVDERYEMMHLISSFLTFGINNTADHHLKSSRCPNHIKFQRRGVRKTVIPASICSGYKHTVNTTQSRFDPLLWLNPVNQLGVYFKQPWNRTQINATAHLVFKIIKKGNECEFRIQRYKIDSKCSTLEQLGYKSLTSDCEVIECNYEKELIQWIQEIPWNWTKTPIKAVKPKTQTRKKPAYIDDYEYDGFGWNNRLNFTTGKSDDGDNAAGFVILLLCIVLIVYQVVNETTSTAVEPAKVTIEEQSGTAAASEKAPTVSEQQSNASTTKLMTLEFSAAKDLGILPTISGSVGCSAETLTSSTSSGSSNADLLHPRDHGEIPSNGTYKLHLVGSASVEIAFEKPPTYEETIRSSVKFTRIVNSSNPN